MKIAVLKSRMHLKVATIHRLRTGCGRIGAGPKDQRNGAQQMRFSYLYQWYDRPAKSNRFCYTMSLVVK